MDSLNLKAAISNLTQMDKLLSDHLKGPGIAQQQNSQLGQDNAVLKAHRANAVDEMDGKRVDGNDKHPHDQHGEGGKKKGSGGRSPSRDKDGHFVDFSA